MSHHQLLQIKVAKSDVKLHRFLYRQTLNQARRAHKPLSWLQFARRSKHGYEFFPDQGYKWTILETIVHAAKTKFPQYRTGEICDLLAFLVNTQVQDILYSSCIQCSGYCSPQRCYCKQLLIEIAGDHRHLIRHPEYLPLTDAKRLSWTAKNLITGSLVAIKRRSSSLFYIYHFSLLP